MNEKRKCDTYEEYFNNRTVNDIMEEWSEHRDEWKPCNSAPEEKTEE